MRKSAYRVGDFLPLSDLSYFQQYLNKNPTQGGIQLILVKKVAMLQLALQQCRNAARLCLYIGNNIGAGRPNQAHARGRPASGSPASHFGSSGKTWLLLQALS